MTTINNKELTNFFNTLERSVSLGHLPIKSITNHPQGIPEGYLVFERAEITTFNRNFMELQCNSVYVVGLDTEGNLRFGESSIGLVPNGELRVMGRPKQVNPEILYGYKPLK